MARSKSKKHRKRHTRGVALKHRAERKKAKRKTRQAPAAARK
jgi:hypothetical protein